MREGWLVVVVAVVLGGCAAPGGVLAPAGETLPPPSWSIPVAMDQPTSGAEPNIAIAPDGTIWITAVAGGQERPNHERGAAWLWRSSDGGESWETLRAPVRETPLGAGVPATRKPFGSSDADVITSPDGWVYYSDWWNWGAPVGAPLPVPLPVSPSARHGSYLVERSPDGGKTWESTPVTTLDSFGGIDRQWLVAGENGWVALFYAYFHGANPSRAAETPDVIAGKSSVQAVYSRDHGATWSEPKPVVVNGPDGFSQIAHPRLTADGLLWMPHGWMGDDGWTSPSEVRVALSDDLGETWRHAKVADAPEGFDNLWAVQGDHTADGTLHVAWGARTGENMTMFHASSADGGESWSGPHALRADGLNFLPWVAAHEDRVAVAWYASNATGDPVEAADETEWWLYVATLGPTGWTVERASPEPVKTGPMCPRGAACPSDRELLDYPSVAFGPDGKLHAAYAVSREVNGAKAGLVVFMGHARA